MVAICVCAATGYAIWNPSSKVVEAGPAAVQILMAGTTTSAGASVSVVAVNGTIYAANPTGDVVPVDSQDGWIAQAVVFEPRRAPTYADRFR